MSPVITCSNRNSDVQVYVGNPGTGIHKFLSIFCTGNPDVYAYARIFYVGILGTQNLGKLTISCTEFSDVGFYVDFPSHFSSQFHFTIIFLNI
jgi:hypothetical protein